MNQSRAQDISSCRYQKDKMFQPVNPSSPAHRGSTWSLAPEAACGQQQSEPEHWVPLHTGLLARDHPQEESQAALRVRPLFKPLPTLWLSGFSSGPAKSQVLTVICDGAVKSQKCIPMLVRKQLDADYSLTGTMPSVSPARKMPH